MTMLAGVVRTVILCCVLAIQSAGFARAIDEPCIVASYPLDDATDVRLDIAINLRFSTALDPRSLSSIKLVDEAGQQIGCAASTDLTNASITITPDAYLNPGREYFVSGDSELRTKDGRSVRGFRRKFTTSRAEIRPSRSEFELATFDDSRSVTTVLCGPDHKLYAADAFGRILRWDLEENGRPVNRTVIRSDPQRNRQYIDLEWDPASTEAHPILLASFALRDAERDERYYFTGTVVRIDALDPRNEEIVVQGLPHGREKQGGFDTLPHQPNGLVFHNGRLYQSIGSTSSSGGPPNWGIREQKYSACILEYDYDSLRQPLDLFPGDSDQSANEAQPFRIFATGIRNALELVSHSNGNLYTATNLNDRGGPQDGVPDHPGISGDQNKLIKGTTPDQESLFIVRRGCHYGFPNPQRDQFVLQGGNPTAAADPFEISDYPVGTNPDDGFAPELMYPIWQYGGTSANGMIEYNPRTTHPLSGCLLCCFYSARRIAVLRLGDDGLPVSVTELRGREGRISFNGPLDLTQDPRTGCLYVADFGRQSEFGADGSLKWLRPAERSNMKTR